MTPKARFRLFLGRHPKVKYLMKRSRRVVVRYHHIGMSDADVLLSSYPRSGSTWLRFMLGDLLSGRGAHFEDVDELIPYAGEHRNVRPLLPRGGRVIKTHELYRPDGLRTIYLVRDARAVLASMYKMQKRLGYPKDMGAFVQDFLAGRSGWFGRWVDHVDFWLGPDPSKRPNILLIRFEDLREDPAPVLERISGFLGVEVEASKLAKVIDDNDLARMKEKERNAPEGAILNRRAELPFVGSGSVEGWRRELDPEHIAVVERAAGTVLERLGYPVSLSR